MEPGDGAPLVVRERAKDPSGLRGAILHQLNQGRQRIQLVPLDKANALGIRHRAAERLAWSLLQLGNLTRPVVKDLRGVGSELVDAPLAFAGKLVQQLRWNLLQCPEISFHGALEPRGL